MTARPGWRGGGGKNLIGGTLADRNVAALTPPMSGHMMRLSRRGMLGLVLAGAAGPVLARAPLTADAPPPRPQGRVSVAARPAAAVPEAGSLVESARLGGTVAFVVLDARTGALLESRNADAPLPPASVAKTITTLYALETLGSGFRFSTSLIATGPVQGGRVAGDLILAGGGDPSLSTDTLGDMAAELRARGITGITGNFRVWGGALPAIGEIDRGQPPHVGYNPAISGLNLNYNRVYFEWKRGPEGYRTSMDARAERFVPAVGMARIRIVDRESPLFTYSAGEGVENWTVASRSLGSGGSRWLPVRQPEAYAGEVFRTLAAQQGIRLPAAMPQLEAPRGNVVVERQSDELWILLRDMLKFSTNLTAECIGLAASHARGGAGSLAASGSRMSAWAAGRFGVAGLSFADHSGLSEKSSVTAGAMAAVMAGLGPEGPLRPLLRAHTIRDAKGREVKDARLRVEAKTGTLNFASGLAGYAAPPAGRELAFAIFSADVARRGRLGPEERENPPGASEWAKRARGMQQQLLDRWSRVYV